jgi:CBS domain-containing protein
LGFTTVYDYTAGKVDWLAAGLPAEGPGPSAPRVKSILDATVPTCGLDEEAGLAVRRSEAAGWPVCVVVNDAMLVAGRLRVDNIPANDRRRAEDAMEGGPATVRAHEDLAAVLGRMANRRVAVLLVSTPEGILLGAIRPPN